MKTNNMQHAFLELMGNVEHLLSASYELFEAYKAFDKAANKKPKKKAKKKIKVKK